MTIAEALRYAVATLSNTSPTPQLDAEVLLAHTLAQSREHILARKNQQLSPNKQQQFDDAVDQRNRHVPIAYITGTKEFGSHIYRVTTDVLVPRPETEHLVEYVAAYINQQPNPITICDIGTGSGCIVTELSHRVAPHHTLLASDLSKSALAIAKHNIQNIAAHPVQLFISDLLKNIPHTINIDVIVANLPYLSHEEVATSPTPDLQHEPRIALSANNNGIEAIAQLLQQVQERKTPIALFLEFLPRQYSEIAERCRTHKFAITPLRDLENSIRFAKIQA